MTAYSQLPGGAPLSPPVVPPPDPAPVVMSSPFGSAPPNDVEPYLSLSTTPTAKGTLNGIERSLCSAEIVGKRVVIDADRPLIALSGRLDVESLAIIAETLEIRTPFLLPQTRISVFARRLIFVDAGQISTTPAANKALPTPQKPGTPPAPDPCFGLVDDGEIPSAGEDGLGAGDLLLYCESLDNSKSQVPLVLSLRGAMGQPGGPGKDPRPGASMAPLPTQTPFPGAPPMVVHGVPDLGLCGLPPPSPDPNYANEIVYFQTYDIGKGLIQLPAGKEQCWPESGHDGVPGGKPGEGGPGGTLTTNLALVSALYDIRGGDCGDAYKDRDAPAPPGSPNPAYRVYCNCGRFHPNEVVRHDGVAGKAAVSPQANAPRGPDGKVQTDGNALSWVRAGNISAVVQYADDLYVSRRAQEAANIYKEYSDLVFRALDRRPASDEAAQLRRLLALMQSRIAQIALGADFYGKPPGWVPMLSFEVTKGVYEAELQRAAQYFYLSYWLGEKIKDAQSRESVLKALYKNGQEQFEEATKNLNDKLVTDIPDAQRDLEAIFRDQSLIAQKLQLREQQLRALAQSDADKQEQCAQSIAAMHMFAAALTLIPVIQPEGAMFAAAIDSIADKDDLWDTVGNVGKAYLFNNSSSSDTCSDLVSNIEGLDWSSLDGFTNSLSSHKGAILGDTQTIVSKANDILAKKAAQTVPSDLVEKLLEQYEATDPDYQQDLADARALMPRKQAALAKLEDLQQNLASLAHSLAAQLESLAQTSQALRDATISASPIAVSIIKDLRLTAERRLKYYMYLTALAFEYRLLQPYTSSLVPDRDGTVLEDAYKANKDTTELTSDQVKLLMAPYTQSLSNIAAAIVDTYLNTDAPLEKSLQTNVRLNATELARLGNGEEIEINLANRKEFQGLEIENLRLTGVNFQIPDVTGAKPDTLHIAARHEGVSKITKNAKVYGFRHLGYDGGASFYWRNSIDFVANTSKPQTDPPDVESLLLSILVDSNRYVLFSTPGLDATLRVWILPRSTRIDIASLVITVDYTYQPIPRVGRRVGMLQRILRFFGSGG